MKNENDFIESSDLSLVAALCCFGAIIHDVDRSAPRAIFHIRKDVGLTQLTQAFFTRSLKVEPLEYFNALKHAKSRLYAAPMP